MRGNEAFNLIPHNPPGENIMEARVARIESDVEYIKRDVRELASGMKAANEAIADLRGSVSTLSAKLDASIESTHTQFARVDATLVRLETKIDANEAKADARFAKLEAKIDENEAKADARFTQLEARTDARFAALEAKTDSRFAALEAKVDSNHASLSAKISELSKSMMQMRGSISELQAMQKAILWVLSIGVLAGIAKAFNWM